MPHYDGKSSSGAGQGYTVSGKAACSGLEIQDYKQTNKAN